MVDTQGYQEIMRIANFTKSAVEAKEWELATNLWSNTEGVILNLTNNIDFYNILSNVNSASSQSDLTRDSLSHLMNFNVKKILQLNSTWGKQSSAVFRALEEDFMKPVIDKGKINIEFKKSY